MSLGGPFLSGSFNRAVVEYAAQHKHLSTLSQLEMDQRSGAKRVSEWISKEEQGIMNVRQQVAEYQRALAAPPPQMGQPTASPTDQIATLIGTIFGADAGQLANATMARAGERAKIDYQNGMTKWEAGRDANKVGLSLSQDEIQQGLQRISRLDSNAQNMLDRADNFALKGMELKQNALSTLMTRLIQADQFNKELGLKKKALTVEQEEAVKKEKQRQADGILDDLKKSLNPREAVEAAKRLSDLGHGLTPTEVELYQQLAMQNAADNKINNDYKQAQTGYILGGKQGTGNVPAYNPGGPAGIGGALPGVGQVGPPAPQVQGSTAPADDIISGVISGKYPRPGLTDAKGKEDPAIRARLNLFDSRESASTETNNLASRIVAYLESELGADQAVKLGKKVIETRGEALKAMQKELGLTDEKLEAMVATIKPVAEEFDKSASKWEDIERKSRTGADILTRNPQYMEFSHAVYQKVLTELARLSKSTALDPKKKKELQERARRGFEQATAFTWDAFEKIAKGKK